MYVSLVCGSEGISYFICLDEYIGKCLVFKRNKAVIVVCLFLQLSLCFARLVLFLKVAFLVLLVFINATGRT